MVTGIVGPMMSGKSSELLQQLERAIIGKKKVCLIRPKVDNRNFFSHSNATQLTYNNLDIPIFYIQELDYDTAIDWKEIRDYDVIGIDEAQFIGGLVDIVKYLNIDNKSIFFSGLLATSESEIFKPIADTLPYCDHIIKLNAVCSICGSDLGNYTYYKEGKKTNSVEVGGKDKYDARCWKCYQGKL